MLALISQALPEPMSLQSEDYSPCDKSARHSRITEGVYAAFVFTAGVLLLINTI